METKIFQFKSLNPNSVGSFDDGFLNEVNNIVPIGTGLAPIGGYELIAGQSMIGPQLMDVYVAANADVYLMIDDGSTREVYRRNMITGGSFSNVFSGTTNTNPMIFCEFGDDQVIFTDGINEVQSIASTDPSSADLITSTDKPKATFVVPMFGLGARILLSNISGTSDLPNGVWWSATDDPSSFGTPQSLPGSNSDFQPVLNDGGEIFGLGRLRDSMLIFQHSSIVQMLWPAEFYVLSNSHGTAFPRSIVETGEAVYFWSESGPTVATSDSVESLSFELIERYLKSNDEIVISCDGVFDRKSRCVKFWVTFLSGNRESFCISTITGAISLGDDRSTGLSGGGEGSVDVFAAASLPNMFFSARSPEPFLPSIIIAGTGTGSSSNNIYWHGNQSTITIKTSRIFLGNPFSIKSIRPIFTRRFGSDPVLDSIQVTVNSYNLASDSTPFDSIVIDSHDGELRYVVDSSVAIYQEVEIKVLSSDDAQSPPRMLPTDILTFNELSIEFTESSGGA